MMVHADRFSFAVTEETAVAGFASELAPGEERGEIDEVLVAFIAVEKQDEEDTENVARQAADRIGETALRVGANHVMVYPYAHLSRNLASPRVASHALDRLVALLALDEALTVSRAPFGYYKSYEIACKGHPLSEVALTLRPNGEHTAGSVPPPAESGALSAERTLRSEWRIYLPDGSHVPASEFNFDHERGVRDLFAYEREGTRVAEEASPHIRLMREQELVDYEPASDTGNLRWYPKGLLVKRLLEQHVTALVVGYGAMEVETPIMYDYGHPALAKYLNRFPARQYLVKSDEKEYFLRFAACFGQYMIQHDMVSSYRDLPLRLYELTHFSFRREQGGEVAGLRRLRAFTMPDMHTLVRDEEMAKAEFIEQVRLCMRWLNDLGLDCVPAIRFVRSFLDEHRGFVSELMATIGRPTLVEVWDERFFYFVTKFEMNFIDAAKKAACLSTVQIDVENSERFDINYVAEDDTKRHPLLMHTSVSGSIDRNIYAMLESQAMQMARGQKATWPVWLAPTQARLLPIADEHVDGALRLAEAIPFRVDVDDRNLRLAKKVRESEREWVPFSVAIGERELAGEKLTVRRRIGEPIALSPSEFVDLLRAQTAGKPSHALNTPRRLSSRPVFVG